MSGIMFDIKLIDRKDHPGDIPPDKYENIFGRQWVACADILEYLFNG